MTFRNRVKRGIYTFCPGLAGAFPYFGTRVYFPKRSLIFDLVCEQGIYERELVSLISHVLLPNTWYFDVGANIGLMSVPILRMSTNVRVMSLEPSPNSRAYLQQTWNRSPWQDRWQIVLKAVGDQTGETPFNLSHMRFGGYDGVANTGRTPSAGVTMVPVTTLDEEWKRLGRPCVRCIKLDVEGSELRALTGATELVQICRPWVFLEWYEANFKPFGHQPQDLLDLADKMHYQLAAIPTLVEIRSNALLSLHMHATASFALVPR